jgi:hypothetical protein
MRLMILSRISCCACLYRETSMQTDWVTHLIHAMHFLLRLTALGFKLFFENVFRSFVPTLTFCGDYGRQM